MQEIETIANVAEILGGGAILISLMYVGYQIRQSNRIAQAAALHSILEGFSDRALAQTVEHPDTIIMMVRGHHSYDKLSIEEKQVFGGILNRDVIHMPNVMQYHDKKLIDDVDYEAWLAYTAAVITTPGGNACWKAMRQAYTPTIVAVLDRYLAENPSAPTMFDMYPQIYGTDAGQIDKA